MFKLLPFNHNAPAYKDKNQNSCVLGYMKVQKLSIFRDFLVVTMGTGNQLRDQNMD